MTTDYLGIDISKAKLDVALLRGEKVHSNVFKNSQVGFTDLTKWLEKHQSNPHIAMEATGSYGLAAAKFLHQNGYLVSVINPVQIKAFGRSKLVRVKTDKADAVLIAKFCKANNPEGWEPLNADLEAMRELNRRLENLKRIKRQEKNRLKTPGSCPEIKESARRFLASVEQEIAELKQLIQSHLDQNTELEAEKNLLITVPGIGLTTAAGLLSEMGNWKRYADVRQLGAYSGLTSAIKQSGSSVRGRGGISKIGNRNLRRLLFMPAMVAMNYNPIIREFCARLLAAGKPKMVVIVAAMRKLLYIAYGVLKGGGGFNPNYLAENS